MIKAEIVDEGDVLHLYVTGSNESEIDSLDLIYQFIMSNKPKDGRYTNSTSFESIVIKSKE